MMVFFVETFHRIKCKHFNEWIQIVCVIQNIVLFSICMNLVKNSIQLLQKSLTPRNLHNIQKSVFYVRLNANISNAQNNTQKEDYIITIRHFDNYRFSIPIDLNSALFGPSSQILEKNSCLSLIFFEQRSYIIQLMEEFKQEQWYLPEEGEKTLLSYKMMKINSIITTKTLIESLNAKNTLNVQQTLKTNEFIGPLFSITTDFHRGLLTDQQSTTKTIKYADSYKKKRNIDNYQDQMGSMQKTAKSRHRRKDEDRVKSKYRERTYKFLKIMKSGNRQDRILLEETVFSLSDINGQGYVVLPQGRIIEGQFIDGVPISHLRIRFQNGIVYEGPVYNYRPHGRGEMITANGQKYVGEFCYGEPHGQGVHYFADGRVKREGEWRHGKYKD